MSFPPPTSLLRKKKALESLKRDRNLTVLLADKGRCNVVLSTAEYHTKVTDLLSYTNTCETRDEILPVATKRRL